MTDSILESIKDAAGIGTDDVAFDAELLLHINTTFVILREIGVGPDTPFIVSDYSATWHDFIDDDSIIPMIKSYVALKVRVLFDPPTSSSYMNAIQESIKEYEWRLNVEVDKWQGGDEDGRVTN